MRRWLLAARALALAACTAPTNKVALIGDPVVVAAAGDSFSGTC